MYLAVAQWALLFALGLLVIVLYRQLGRHFRLSQPDTALGPPVGSEAARFEYARVTDASAQHFTPGNGTAALVAFVGPTCPACEDLVVALGEAADAGELVGVRVLLLISDPPSYLQISEPFRTTRLEVGRIVADATLEAYRASATPLLVAIDGTGIVRSAGPVIDREEVRAFAVACLLPSPQHPPLPVVPTGAANGQMPEATTTTTEQKT
jgi:hypothetical protein